MSRFKSKLVEFEAITFDELVAHGVAQGVPCYNGMPWSFTYGGHPITHENDDCYIVPTRQGFVHFDRGDMLITSPAGDGEIYPCKPDVFALKYEPAA